MKTAKERLIEFLAYLAIGQNKFEDIVGLSRAYVSHIKSSVGSDIIFKIYEAYPELNLEWLITGNGNMLRSENKNTATSKGAKICQGCKDKEKTIKSMEKINQLLEDKIDYLEHLLENEGIQYKKVKQAS
jgi:hypothetical protein